MPNTIPSRDELLDRLRRANSTTVPWVTIRLVAAVVLAALIDWPRVLQTPIISVAACVMLLGPFFGQLLTMWGQKKKRLEDIKEITRFGELDKYKLQTLFQQTLKKLSLPDDRINVYVTGDKSLNAGSVRLGRVFGSLDGIYLNRQILHKLREDEIQAVMGHELGHYYRFYLTGSRYQMLTLALGSLLALFVVQKTGLDDWIGFMVLAVVAFFFWRISNTTSVRDGRAIEHLCDDFGAQVNGIEAAISGLMKVGLDAEQRYHLELELLARAGKHEVLTPKDVLAAVEKSIPYGHVADDQLYESVQAELKAKAKAKRQTSISGFLRYMWESEDADDEDYMQELQQRAKQLNEMQRLDWESVLGSSLEAPLTQTQLQRLVQLIEDNPQQMMFRLPDQNTDVHPPLPDRIRYLWKNRESELVDGRWG